VLTRNAIGRLLQAYSGVNLVPEAAGFTQTVPLTSASTWLRIAPAFSRVFATRKSVDVHREKRLPTKQCLDAFDDTFGFALGTNSLESRLLRFVA
jgi:hypothetical protein